MQPSIDIIIPTYDNEYWLSRCLRSIAAAKFPELDRVIVVDNFGNVEPNAISMVARPGRNLGWTGGLIEGLKCSDAPFVMFLNDDTEFECFPDRLGRLLEHFSDDSVGMVGPATGIAMGAQALPGPDIEPTKLLIGFCQLIRRSALEKIGGIDASFVHGGDDFDLCIRLTDAGYKLVIDRRVFVYHHAFKTGNRLYGNSRIPGGWNSQEMATKVYERISDKYGKKRLLELIAAPDYVPQTLKIQ